MTARVALAAALAALTLGACSRAVSDWQGTWSGQMTGTATFPGCTSTVGDRPVVLELAQDGERITGTATFPTGAPGGGCTFVNAAGQPRTFEWSVLTQVAAWLTGGAGAEVSVEGTVSGDVLDLGGLELTMKSDTSAAATIDLSRFDAEGEFNVRLTRESRAAPTPAG